MAISTIPSLPLDLKKILLISGWKFIFFILYVGGIFLVANDLGLLREFKEFLSKNLQIKDVSEASHVIGIEIFQNKAQGLLELSQKTYINKLLERFRIKKCLLSIVPIKKGDTFNLMQCSKNELKHAQMEMIPYASIVGSLMYA